MSVAVVQKLPPFDTGEYQGAGFEMAGGNARLIIHVSGLASPVLEFTRVRWHQFTALYNCSPEVIHSAYFQLVEVLASPQLAAFIRSDSAPTKAYKDLRHYRIFLDETGCHEVFAESAAAL